MKFSCQDHQGADVARVQQWDGKEWKIISGYYKADLSILDPMVKDAVGQVRGREEDHAARLLEGELTRHDPAQRSAERASSTKLWEAAPPPPMACLTERREPDRCHPLQSPPSPHRPRPTNRSSR